MSACHFYSFSERKRLPQAITNILEQLGPQLGITQIDFFVKLEWQNIDEPMDQNRLVLNRVHEILNEGISKVKDIVILTMFESTGLEVLEYLKMHSPYRVSHVYDLSRR